VIACPTLRRDGFLLAAYGYDHASGLFNDWRDGDLGLSAAPSKAEALEALDDLLYLLREFAFATGDDTKSVDRAVALSALTSPVLRGAMDVCPLHGVTAPAPGSGKSFLIDVAAMISTGRRCPDSRLLFCERQWIWRKGGPRPADSDLQTRSENGASRETNVSGQSAGNGGCGPRTPYPRRASNCPGLFGLRRDSRKLGLDPLGSYSGWGRLVRAPLVWLGCGDPADSIKTSREADSGLRALQAFILFARDKFKSSPFSVADIIGLMRHSRLAGVGYEQHSESDDERERRQETEQVKEKINAEFRELLLSIAGIRGVVNGNRLSTWLRRNLGRIIGAYRIEEAPRDAHRETLRSMIAKV
jgi:hypothetical protein